MRFYIVKDLQRRPNVKPTLQLFLMVLATVLLLLATIGIPGHQYFSLGWGGLFFWALATLLKPAP
jgi:hypothetical protein